MWLITLLSHRCKNDQSALVVLPLMTRSWVDAGYIGMAVASATLYLTLPNWAYALTIWPSVILFGAVGAICCLRARRGKWRVPIGIGGTIMLTGFLLMDTPLQFFRRPGASNFVVVSLNCAGGLPSAAREVSKYKPDLVLLQERPGIESLHALAKELWGSSGQVVVSPDNAILFPGKAIRQCEPVSQATANNAWAIIDHPKGRFAVCSLRLNPPIFRLDLWDPDAWATYARNKAARKLEVDELLSTLPPEFTIGSATNVILGGDFNTPPDRTILGPLQSKLNLRDSFWDAGLPWGGTAVNDYPVVRIDQIWSRGMKPAATRAHRTVNSDHRVVVAEFWVNP